MTKRRRAMKGPALVLWAGFLVLTLGGEAALVERRQIARRASWPTTMGRVTRSDVEVENGRFGRTYRPRVRYQYSAGGRSYSGEQAPPTKRSLFDNEYDAWASLERYSPGAPVTVRYNPRDPVTASLATGSKEGEPSGWVPVAAAGAVVMAVGLAGCLLAIRSRSVTILLDTPAVRKRFPQGREIPAAQRAPAGERHPSVTAHSGEPLPRDLVFFQGPPAQIGTLLSAGGTLRRGTRLWTDRARVPLVLAVFGLFVGLGVACLLLGDLDDRFTVDAAAVLSMISIGAPGVLALTRSEHAATYVGRDGAARYVMYDGAAGPLVEEVIRFDEVVGVSRTDLPNFHRSDRRQIVRQGWIGAGGREAWSLELSWRQGPDGTPTDGRGDFHFANAAAAAWAAHRAVRGHAGTPMVDPTPVDPDIMRQPVPCPSRPHTPI